MSDFMTLAKKLNEPLRKNEVYLNFQGYTDTWRTYLHMDDSNLVDKFTLSKECLMWADYFGAVMTSIQYLLRREKSREKYYRSFYESTPANHSKFPQIKEQYEEIKKFRQELEIFYRQLKNQRYAFMKASRDLSWGFKRGWAEFKSREYMHLTDET